MFKRSAPVATGVVTTLMHPAMIFRLQAVLVDPGKAGPSGVGAPAKRRGRKKVLQPQRTKRATAQALAGPSSKAVKGKRALRSPAATAAERHAKKQKQDAKKHKVDGGKLEKRFSSGEEAARTLTMMSGRSGQAARDTATSNDIVDSRPKPAAPSPSQAKKTRSLQALSGPTAAMGAELQSAERGLQTSRPRGRHRKHPLPASKQQGHAVATEEKQENPLKNDGSGADEIFIPLEMSDITEDEAAETDENAAPALEQGDIMAADRDDWGAGEKAASPGSPTAAATQRKRQAKEKVSQTCCSDEASVDATYMPFVGVAFSLFALVLLPGMLISVVTICIAEQKHASPKKAPGGSGGAKVQKFSFEELERMCTAH